MRGIMMDRQLTITSIMQHADKYHGNQAIVSVTADKRRHRTTYAETFARTRQLANALTAFGITEGDRIATLAWNDHRHMELYYGIAGIGAVTHTVNPRLFPEQIIYIINHARDRIVFVDPLVLSAVENVAGKLDTVEAFVILTDDAHLPETTLRNVQSYESFISDHGSAFDWPELDEWSACALCYTSGTTGNPKGVLYAHRSMVIHSMAAVAPDVFNLSARDVVLPVVPMFHANAWGLCYAGPMSGAKLVFPGPKMGDGETLQALIEEERVNFSAAVPTVWLALLKYLDDESKRVDSLKSVVIGGSACPWAVMDEFEKKYGVFVHHAWGMTEMSPLGTVMTYKAGMDQLPAEKLRQLRLKQGRPLYGVETKIVDDEGKELPWNGESAGILKVRGPWICSDYYRQEGESDAHDAGGWFATGDIGNIDADGFLQLTDRAKDVIKSGGEWISSIDLENAAVGHPQVAEAAVIGVAHPKWQERPLLVVVKADGEEPTSVEILDYLKDKVACWWLPDDVQFVDSIPHTATGKINKLELRKQFQDYTLPGTSRRNPVQLVDT